MVKLGIIARSDDRGLAHQSYDYCRGLNPDRVLLVLGANRKFVDHPERYDEWETHHTVLLPSARTGGPALDFASVKRFFRGLDMVLSAETLYDWNFADWCRAADCRTAIVGNPEMYVHDKPLGRNDVPLPHPDRWIWPTRWMTDQLPRGPILPVPCADRGRSAADPNDETLRVLHVAGHAAIGDRNGTDSVFEAISYMTGKIHLTIIGQDGAFPIVRRHPPPSVTWECHPLGYTDRWSMYQNQHVVLQPRRYGGNYMVATEAVSCGLTTLMPDCPPNDMWPGDRIRCTDAGGQHVPFGVVPTVACSARAIGEAVDRLANDRDHLADLMHLSHLHVERNGWKRWEPEYRKFLT